MSKNKKNKKTGNRADPRFISQEPSANSAEFVPSAADMPLLNNDVAGLDEPFDFIPDVKGNKFS